MPYLNWKAAPLGQDVSAAAPAEAGGGSAGDKVRLSLTIPAALRGELLSHLREVLSGDAAQASAASELRIDLPREWILFWKLRDGESRLLIAHPQPEEWVATAALSPEHAASLLRRLAAAEAGQAIRVSELAPGGAVARVSNVDLVLAIS